MKSKRTQSERTAATRTALIRAGRKLFGERGFAAVSTPEIATEAGVSRGALYHQFADKQALFAAVAEEVEAGITQRLVERVQGAEDPLRMAVDAWLDIAHEPEVRRILLTDGPVVLGWDAWRELITKYGLGLTEQLLQAGMDAGVLRAQPVRPLAIILAGALNEAAIYVADADDPDVARAEVRAVLEHVLAGVTEQP
ncbi:TetR/AcrR family transcriptional regulator [Solirubrobacter taibaiensis]|nr:TetR/AcrR family transcriptional regulator [Solirubrobacter taibaiensis]